MKPVLDWSLRWILILVFAGLYLVVSGCGPV